MFFCLAFASLFFVAGNVNIAYADVPQSEEYYGLDYDTYRALQAIYKTVTGDTYATSFTSKFFSGETNFSALSPTTTDGQNIQKDLEKGELHLVVGENAEYDCLKTLSPLSSLAGLNNLSFGGISKLYLDNNELENIESSQLESFTNLTNLSINDNGLKAISLPKSMQENLTSLSLMNNELRTLDLSSLKTGASVNLFNNYIENLSDLKFSNTLSSLDISFNNILDTTEEELDAFKSAIDCSPILLVQGLKQDLKAMSKLTTYNNSTIASQFTTIVSYRTTAGDASVFSGEITRSDYTQTISTIYMPIGKLTIKFAYTKAKFESYHLNKLGNDSNSYNDSNPYKVNIAPVNPTVVCKVEGETVTNFLTEKDLEFSQTITFDSGLPNYETAVQNTTLKVTGLSQDSSSTTYLITTKGKYNLQFYAEFDGLKSSGVSIYAEKTGKDYTTLAVILVVVIISLVACSIFIKRWLSNGAVVAPLSEKEIYQANKRASRSGKTTRLSYPFEKGDSLDESGVYRKNKGDYFSQDYVDLNDTQKVEENDVSGDFDESAENFDEGYDGQEDGDDFYEEN